MDTKIYKLWDENTPYFVEEYGQKETFVEAFLVDNNCEKNKCIIIVPGGGYSFVSIGNEGTPVAQFYNKSGISAFILNYRVHPYDHRAIFSDIQRAIRFVRYNAEKFNIDPDKIGVMGFSAGAHLSLCASEHFDFGKAGSDAVDSVSSRPDICILCYPVVSFSDELTHRGTRDVFIGRDEDYDSLSKHFSGELSVKENTPPTFIWHTAEDATVSVKNSLVLASALQDKNIPLELHVFPKGRHGLGVVPGDKFSDEWLHLLTNWFDTVGF